MFDFAFSELVVVLLVALIVIGPERLPKVARTAGHLWGRMQRYVHNVKNDIANNMAIEEARQLQSSIRKDVDAVRQSVKDTEMTIEQKILQAQHGKLPDAPDEQDKSVVQPHAPGKQVDGSQ
ncbi:MAG: twin-arginine translocase subunit TatB [Gallionella sp.]|nr:MAG: twin-arginine translocase subunit TatB [Gallionella sp.]